MLFLTIWTRQRYQCAQTINISNTIYIYLVTASTKYQCYKHMIVLQLRNEERLQYHQTGCTKKTRAEKLNAKVKCVAIWLHILLNQEAGREGERGRERVRWK